MPNYESGSILLTIQRLSNLQPEGKLICIRGKEPRQLARFGDLLLFTQFSGGVRMVDNGSSSVLGRVLGSYLVYIF